MTHRGAHDEQIKGLRDIYNKRLRDSEKTYEEKIKQLRQQIAEYEASSDESYQSVDTNISTNAEVNFMTDFSLNIF